MRIDDEKIHSRIEPKQLRKTVIKDAIKCSVDKWAFQRENSVTIVCSEADTFKFIYKEALPLPCPVGLKWIKTSTKIIHHQFHNSSILYKYYGRKRHRIGHINVCFYIAYYTIVILTTIQNVVLSTVSLKDLYILINQMTESGIYNVK